MLNFSKALIGHIPGGLSHVNIVGSMVFSGVTGSAVADTSAIGSVLIPAMKKEGYGAGYAAAVTAASSTIGPIIPPSIPLVVFGLLGQASIGDLFLGGVFPGLVMGLFLLASSYLISRRRRYPASHRASFKELISSFGQAFLALLMPLIIVGGMTTGVVTTSEAGVVAVAYAILLGLLVFRGFSLRDLPGILVVSAINTGVILIIIATTGLFSYLVADMQTGQILVDFFGSISQNPVVILCLVVVFFLIWGAVLDPITALVVLVPLLLPLVESVGIDIIHFGVVIVLTLMIGLVTPPVGIVLYLSASLANCSFEEVVRESWIFLFALFLVLAICIFIPDLVLWLPRYLSA